MSVLKVVICDDDKKCAQTTEKVLVSCLKDLGFAYEIKCFHTTEACLDFVLKNHVDLIIMDIFLDNNKLGTKLAIHIRKFNTTAKLIFLSTSNEFATEGFAAEASYYLLKPVSKEAMAYALNRCQLAKPANIVSIDTGSKIITINPAELIAIEVQNKTALLHTIHGIISENCSLSVFREHFQEPDFVSPYRSFIINLQHVRNIDDDFFYMSNGEKFIITARNNKQIKQQYMEWLLTQMDMQN